MQTSDNMSTAHDVYFDATLAVTRGCSNHYFSFATSPMGVGIPRVSTTGRHRNPSRVFPTSRHQNPQINSGLKLLMIPRVTFKYTFQYLRCGI